MEIRTIISITTLFYFTIFVDKNLIKFFFKGEKEIITFTYLTFSIILLLTSKLYKPENENNTI